jgi:ketosteroid isomerase-like protein
MYRSFFDRFSVVEHTTSFWEIRVTDDLACVWGSDKLVVTPKTGGAPVELNGHAMSILQRDAQGVWRFARGINNLSPKPAAISSEK